MVEWMHWFATVVVPFYVTYALVDQLVQFTPTFLWLAFSLARLAVPLFILQWYRHVYTRRLVLHEPADIRDGRDDLVEQFTASECNVMTVFFQDYGEDELSVCHYTGPLEPLFANNPKVVHLEAASIIAYPHIVDYPPCPENDALFNFDELRFLYPRHWWDYIQSRWIYLTQGEIRRGLSRIATWSRKGDSSDTEKGKAMFQTVFDNDPHRHYVLFGVGRGATVALHVAASLQGKARHQVKGLILEACPSVPIDPFPHKHMDFLLVTSRGDSDVPPKQTAQLKKALDASGVHRVDTVVLHQSRNGHYYQDDPRDVFTYETAAWDWYQRLVVY